MPYNDASVYVEDVLGDQGFDPARTAPWWLSPDIDIPAHSGTAFQGSNTVQIRVHTHEEPILDDKIVAEVYVGNPSLAMSPVSNTKRIDPGNLLFRAPGVAGTEPVAGIAGATLTFSWTPSNAPTDLDGPGHRCLVVRAFPQSVTPPTDPFDVPNEQHEAQHNLDVVATTMMKVRPGMFAGAGIPEDPRKRDGKTGLWFEQINTVAAGDPGTRYVAWAFDPHPDQSIRRALPKRLPISEKPPQEVKLEVGRRHGKLIDPHKLVDNGVFMEKSGFGTGLWSEDRLLAGAQLDLDSDAPLTSRLGFDHTNVRKGGAVVLHGAQWTEGGRPEGGITIVALAPVSEPAKSH